jgi:hypothetical protein
VSFAAGAAALIPDSAARRSGTNPGGALKPGMFVDVASGRAGRAAGRARGRGRGDRTRQLVFVDKGGGRLEPREVTVGARSGEWIAIDRGSPKADRRRLGQLPRRRGRAPARRARALVTR